MKMLLLGMRVLAFYDRFLYFILVMGIMITNCLSFSMFSFILELVFKNGFLQSISDP